MCPIIKWPWSKGFIRGSGKKYNISKASSFIFVTFSTKITQLRKSILDATSRSFLNFRQITSCPNDDGGFLHQPEKLRLQTKLPLYGHKKTKRKISEYHRSVCASQIFAVKMRRINGQQQHKFANFTFFSPKRAILVKPIHSLVTIVQKNICV